VELFGVKTGGPDGVELFGVKTGGPDDAELFGVKTGGPDDAELFGVKTGGPDGVELFGVKTGGPDGAELFGNGLPSKILASGGKESGAISPFGPKNCSLLCGYIHNSIFDIFDSTLCGIGPNNEIQIYDI